MPAGCPLLGIATFRMTALGASSRPGGGPVVASSRASFHVPAATAPGAVPLTCQEDSAAPCPSLGVWVEGRVERWWCGQGQGWRDGGVDGRKGGGWRCGVMWGWAMTVGGEGRTFQLRRSGPVQGDPGGNGSEDMMAVWGVSARGAGREGRAAGGRPAPSASRKVQAGCRFPQGLTRNCCKVFYKTLMQVESQKWLEILT